MTAHWPLWKKLLFRFFFIYIVLYISPWTWLDSLPYVKKVTGFYSTAMDWLVEQANAKLFHVKDVLVPLNGSGDTSYGWTQLYLFLLLAAAGALVWSIIDRKRISYKQLNYWLCLFLRYYIAMVALSYGIIKIFAQQMPFPGYSQLATPLGDYLPMRLSWMFMGYSTPYQVFSGVMEVVVGLLLLWRRTATLGMILSAGVFLNVMMLNLSYDIPVKLFSMHMVFFSVYMLVNEYERILCFFILQKPAAQCSLYHFSYTQKWLRISRVVMKIIFIVLMVGVVVYESWGYYKEEKTAPEPAPFVKGVYDVKTFAVNGDTLAPLLTDTIRWRDFIMDNSSLGSVGSSDTLFRRRYGRGYFNYDADTVTQMMAFTVKGDTIALLHYTVPDNNSIILSGIKAKDSLYVVLQKSKRHFQLAEKQFHWLSEYNR